MTPLKHWEWSVLTHSKCTVFLLISSAFEAKFSSRISTCVSQCVREALTQPWFLSCSYCMVLREAHLGCPRNEPTMWKRVQFSWHWCACSGRCHKHPWINKGFTAHTIPDEWVPAFVPGRTYLHTQKHIQNYFLYSFHCQRRSRAWSCKWKQPGKKQHRK